MKVEWVLEGNTLGFTNKRKNEKYIVSAEHMYSYLFEGQNIELNGIEFEIDRLTCPVKVSKFPINITLVISGVQSKEEFAIIGEFHLSAKDSSNKIKNLLSRKTDHIVLDGIWYPFPSKILDVTRELVEELQLDNLENISLINYTRILNQENLFPFKIQNDVGASIFSSQIKLPNYQPGQYFSGKLYPYQLRGYKWLRWIKTQGIGCVLGDEMGLGKTIQVIALLAGERYKSSLIIAPATLLENWRREILKFAPEINTIIHRGGSRTGYPSDLETYDVVITSYGTAVRDRYMLGLIDWNIVALDEAQAIKNPKAERTIAMSSFSKKTGIAITGTPLENRVTDLWSLFNFTNLGMLGNLNSFQDKYEKTLEKAKGLESKISPFLLRRMVTEVADDLPPKIEIPQFIEMDPESINGYEDLRAEIQIKYGKNANFVSLTKLRQYCCHPLIFDADEIPDLTINSQKYIRLIEILSEIFESKEKAVIFTSYSKMVDLLVVDIHNRLSVYGNFIDGRVPVEDRQLIVDEFNEITDAGFLVLNPRAAGTGLNITGANHVIHYNPEWNPAIEDQASARVYRLGQTRPVTIHRLIYTDSVEEIMNERLEFKRTLADLTVVGTQVSSNDLGFVIKALSVTPKRNIEE
jgi:SNF2 family DNA or RNA helicase